MSKASSHQILLLELLTMSGDVAIRDDINGTILGRTLQECRNAGWVSVRQFAVGYTKVSITESGRAIVNDGMNSQA